MYIWDIIYYEEQFFLGFCGLTTHFYLCSDVTYKSVYSMSQEVLQFVHYELRLIKGSMPGKWKM